MNEGKYSGVDRYALQHFKGCHNRVRDGKVVSISWPRTKAGYLAFCSEIGPIPEEMVKPSVGRKNHNLGYDQGNIQWEEHKFNSVKRRGTKFEGVTDAVVQLRVIKFRKGSKEHKEHQSKISTKRWSDPAQHKAMSKRMLGNQHARRN